MAYKNKQDLYKSQIKRWINCKIKAIEYLGGSCVVCGYNKYYGALEFHHKDPFTKRFTWTKLRLYPWGVITEELDKCQLLCGNCHRELHDKERLSSPSELLEVKHSI